MPNNIILNLLPNLDSLCRLKHSSRILKASRVASNTNLKKINLISETIPSIPQVLSREPERDLRPSILYSDILHLQTGWKQAESVWEYFGKPRKQHCQGSKEI